jgi:hypothetical protein
MTEAEPPGTFRTRTTEAEVRLAKALEAARAIVEFLEWLKEVVAAVSVGRTTSTDRSGSPRQKASALIPPEDAAILDAWVQELRKKHATDEPLIVETLREQYMAEGNQAGMAGLVGRARKHFEEKRVEVRKQQEIEASWNRPALADANERLRKIDREQRKARRMPGRATPKTRGPRLGRRRPPTE